MLHLLSAAVVARADDATTRSIGMSPPMNSEANFDLPDQEEQALGLSGLSVSNALKQQLPWTRSRNVTRSSS